MSRHPTIWRGIVGFLEQVVPSMQEVLINSQTCTTGPLLAAHVDCTCRIKLSNAQYTGNFRPLHQGLPADPFGVFCAQSALLYVSSINHKIKLKQGNFLHCSILTPCVHSAKCTVAILQIAECMQEMSYLDIYVYHLTSPHSISLAVPHYCWYSRQAFSQPHLIYLNLIIMIHLSSPASDCNPFLPTQLLSV